MCGRGHCWTSNLCPEQDALLDVSTVRVSNWLHRVVFRGVQAAGSGVSHLHIPNCNVMQELQRAREARPAAKLAWQLEAAKAALAAAEARAADAAAAQQESKKQVCCG